MNNRRSFLQAHNIDAFQTARLGSVVYVLSGTESTLIFDSGHPAASAQTCAHIKKYSSTDREMAACITHYHADHLGAAAAFQESLSIPLYAPAIKANQSFERIQKDVGLTPRPFVPDTIVHDRETYSIGGEKIISITSGGHSENHTSYYLPKRKVLFAGDIFTNSGLGPLDFTQYYKDALNKMEEAVLRLMDLEIEIICPGHGDPIKNSRGFMKKITRRLNSFRDRPSVLLHHTLVPLIFYIIETTDTPDSKYIIDFMSAYATHFTNFYPELTTDAFCHELKNILTGLELYGFIRRDGECISIVSSALVPPSF